MTKKRTRSKRDPLGTEMPEIHFDVKLHVLGFPIMAHAQCHGLKIKWWLDKSHNCTALLEKLVKQHHSDEIYYQVLNAYFDEVVSLAETEARPAFEDIPF